MTAVPKEDYVREFDLNVEKILENWEVYHAIREIIANALDEQIITQTEDISIFQLENSWHIVDYGRGLNYHHLTQKENEEKINNEKLIGRFGVGLKDALATLDRHEIKVKISSKYGIISLRKTAKAGFDDIVTLHADIMKPQDENMVGTDFCLEGCTEEDIEKAKSLFLKFSDSTIIERTNYGDVIKKQKEVADIYINGVRVAEEPNFLFSYNITSLNAKLKKALNRERSNVGRTAYSDRIKSILLECKEEQVILQLADDLQKFGSGEKHDELHWSDVELYASRQLTNLNPKSTFITPEQSQMNPDILDEMERDGYTPIVIDEKLANKMEDFNREAEDGEVFTTVKRFAADRQSRFKPTIIDAEGLTESEKYVYEKTDKILELIGGKPKEVKEICITENIYEDENGFKVVGLWQKEEHRILVKRNQLYSLSDYAGTLLHECAHARSGAGDVNRDFELELTRIIGVISSQLM